jgi:hypothetical protein
MKTNPNGEIMRVFAHITKVDEERREVWGRATQEVVDKSGEIFDYESSKPYFQSWSDEVKADSGGKSLGNIRSMHGKVAAGKVIAIDFNDAEKAIDIGTKIVDDNEWEKVMEGVHTGFSIGGMYVKKWTDGDYQRFTANPNEISIVDRPCVPTAKFFDIIKSDGSVEKKEFSMSKAGGEVNVGGAPEAAVDELARMIDAGVITPARLIELAKADKPQEDPKPGTETASPAANAAEAAPAAAPAEKSEAGEAAPEAQPAAAAPAAPAEPEVKKSMWDVSDFASVLQSISWLTQSAEWEAQYEGDSSPIPAQLRAWIADGVKIFTGMAAEEASELVASLKEQAGEVEVEVMALSAKNGGLAKAGAKFSTTTKEAIGKIHKMVQDVDKAMGELGYADKDKDEDESQEKSAANAALNKSETHNHAYTFGNDLGKVENITADQAGVIEKAVKVLVDERETLQKRVKELEALPAAGKGPLMAVSKSADTIEKDEQQVEPVKKSDGSVDDVATEFKKVFASGGTPVIRR